MDVIGVGFGRTGTLSLKAAVERLGFGPCLHMVSVIEDEARAELWLRAADGEPECIPEALAGFRSSVDWPGVYFWRDLVRLHPEAKFVLTTRDPVAWYESAEKTIFRVAVRRQADSGPMPAFVRMVQKTVWDGTFKGRFTERDFALGVMAQHNEAVRREIPADRLLEFQVRQGWQPLCDFLGVDVPDEEFPRLNDSAAFNERVAEWERS